jgi:hypothetical protein
MMFRNAARAIVLLAVTTAMAQGTSPAGTVPGGTEVIGQGRGLAGRRISSQAAKRLSGVQAPATLRQRMEDLEKTLNQMHVVLKQMHVKAAKSSVKDSLAKTDLDMWELMVGHLDKELQELRVAATAREDLEARRAALYKQADAKAEAEAQAARAAQAAKFAAGAPTPARAGQGGGQSPAGQTAPGQPSPGQPSTTPPADHSPSPN